MTPSGSLRRRPAFLAPALALGALFGAAPGGCADNITDADIKPVPLAEVRALTLRQAATPESKLIVLIDPRAKARYDAGHLSGAMNIKLPQVPAKSATDPRIAAYDHIIVYGTDPGNAAARAMTKRLLSVGYHHVRLFAGGVTEWAARGYTLESAEPPPPDQPAPAAPGSSP